MKSPFSKLDHLVNTENYNAKNMVAIGVIYIRRLYPWQRKILFQDLREKYNFRSGEEIDAKPLKPRRIEKL